jgi:hypothetical protein
VVVTCIEGQDSIEDLDTAGDRGMAVYPDTAGNGDPGTAEVHSYWVVDHMAVDSTVVALVETLPCCSNSGNLPERDCLSTSLYSR